MIYNGIQQKSIIKIDGVKGKQVVTRCYKKYGMVNINYKPIDSKSNHPVITLSVSKKSDIQITVLGKVYNL